LPVGPDGAAFRIVEIYARRIHADRAIVDESNENHVSILAWSPALHVCRADQAAVLARRRRRRKTPAVAVARTAGTTAAPGSITGTAWTVRTVEQPGSVPVMQFEPVVVEVTELVILVPGATGRGCGLADGAAWAVAVAPMLTVAAIAAAAPMRRSCRPAPRGSMSMKSRLPAGGWVQVPAPSVWLVLS
jgi:hypothetical protein